MIIKKLSWWRRKEWKRTNDDDLEKSRICFYWSIMLLYWSINNHFHLYQNEDIINQQIFQLTIGKHIVFGWNVDKFLFWSTCMCWEVFGTISRTRTEIWFCSSEFEKSSISDFLSKIRAAPMCIPFRSIRKRLDRVTKQVFMQNNYGEFREEIPIDDLEEFISNNNKENSYWQCRAVQHLILVLFFLLRYIRHRQEQGIKSESHTEKFNLQSWWIIFAKFVFWFGSRSTWLMFNSSNECH